jgi:hypothetical protein
MTIHNTVLLGPTGAVQYRVVRTVDSVLQEREAGFKTPSRYENGDVTDVKSQSWQRNPKMALRVEWNKSFLLQKTDFQYIRVEARRPDSTFTCMRRRDANVWSEVGYSVKCSQDECTTEKTMVVPMKDTTQMQIVDQILAVRRNDGTTDCLRMVFMENPKKDGMTR